MLEKNVKNPNKSRNLLGKLFLVPTTLGSFDTIHKVIPEYNLQIMRSLDVFIVEQLRTARRFLKKAGHPTPIDDMQFYELNKFTDEQEISDFLKPAINGRSIGLLSEAGTPCIADPGAVIVRLAHRAGIQVVPLVGPNSIVLALMASGLNGQRFCFHGYLPVEGAQLGKKIKELDANSRKMDQTEIFIETPYRNRQMLESLIKHGRPQSLLCIATDLSLESERIETNTLATWKKKSPDFHKKPSVFLLYSK